MRLSIPGPSRGEAAWAPPRSRSPNTHDSTHLATKYRRIAARRGPKKALVAVGHALLIAIWNIAHTGADYDDPDPDY